MPERGILLGHLTNPKNVKLLEDLIADLYRRVDSGRNSVSATQSLAAGTVVLPNARVIRVQGSGGAVTLTATPTIPDADEDGVELTIIGAHDTNTVVFQRESVLAGSNLHLGVATRTLGNGDVLSLVFDRTNGTWMEQSFVDNG